MFDKTETAEKLIAIIAQVLNIDKSTISTETTFEKIGVDSLDKLEIIMAVEENFDITISDDEEARLKTIAQAVDLIHELRNK